MVDKRKFKEEKLTDDSKYALQYAYYKEDIYIKEPKALPKYLVLGFENKEDIDDKLKYLIESYKEPFSYVIKDNKTNKILGNGIKGEIVDFYDIPEEFSEQVIETNMNKKNNPFVIMTGDQMHTFDKLEKCQYFITEDNEFRMMKDVIAENLKKDEKTISPNIQDIVKNKSR